MLYAARETAISKAMGRPAADEARKWAETGRKRGPGAGNEEALCQQNYTYPFPLIFLILLIFFHFLCRKAIRLSPALRRTIRPEARGLKDRRRHKPGQDGRGMRRKSAEQYYVLIFINSKDWRESRRTRAAQRREAREARKGKRRGAGRNEKNCLPLWV